MGYDRVIAYGQLVDLYRYERLCTARGVSKGRDVIVSITDGVPLFLEDRKDDRVPKKQDMVRTKQSARRAAVSLRRLVGANLVGPDKPLFLSLTYGPNMQSVEQARKDFKTFERRTRHQFGNSIRYISVFEFQERGAVHFHVLLWGVDQVFAQTERSTRLFAELWGQGFVDIVATDGSVKLAWYISEYFAKTFADKRLTGKRAYIASKNVLRPVDDKNAVITLYFSGESPVDLRDALLVYEQEYDTQWLGRANYQQYQFVQ